MTTKAKTKPSRFKQARADIPPSLVGGCADDARTMGELIHAARIQLDLIEEGQDGTEEDNPDEIRKWLKKWGR